MYTLPREGSPVATQTTPPIADLDLAEVDLFDLRWHGDGPPHELFARMRREAPMRWNPLPDGSGCWTVMRHGDVTLCESRAICTYIDRVFDGPPLIPADAAAAARIEQWISIVCTAVDPLFLRQYFAAYLFPGTPDGSPNRSVIDAVVPKMEPIFGVLDRAVAATGHLAGASFTLADAYLTPILHYMERHPESRALLTKAANLKPYLERMRTRPSIAQTTPAVAPGGRR